jgi:HAD superfamily hydrolase (TIGR01509 family)
MPAIFRCNARLAVEESPMTATLLFDLDGTLAETDPIHLAAFVKVFEPYGIPMDEEIFRAKIVGQPNAAIGAAFFPTLSHDERMAICDYKEAVYRSMVGEIEPLHGVRPLLEWAKAAGVRCGVVTNAPRQNADLILNGAGIMSYFGVVVCAQELVRSKPDPLPYLTALEALGGDVNRSVAFEDSPAGLTAAVAAGLPTIGMTTNLPASRVLELGAVMAASDYHDDRMLAFIKARVA